jgi:hypothetical protein
LTFTLRFLDALVRGLPFITNSFHFQRLSEKGSDPLDSRRKSRGLTPFRTASQRSAFSEHTF